MGTIITILVILQFLIIIALSYFLYNSSKLNKIYEQTIIELREDIADTYERLVTVDLNGAFESDDEVGFVFSHLKNMIKSLNEKYNAEEDQE